MHKRRLPKPSDDRSGRRDTKARSADAGPAGPDVDLLQLAAGNATLARFLAPGQGERRLQRRVGATRVDPARPEPTSIDVTGRYAVSTGGFMLQLNQAGRHVEGWMQRRVFEEGEHRLEVSRLEGELEADAGSGLLFQYTRQFENGQPYVRGTLFAQGAGEAVIVSLSEGGWSKDFTRSVAAPRLSEAAIESMPEEMRRLVRASETAPLDPLEEELLRDLAEQIERCVKEYYAGMEFDTELHTLNLLVRGSMTAFPSEQRQLAIHRLRRYLAGREFRVDSVKRPLLDWMQAIVDAKPDRTKSIQEALAISPVATTASAGGGAHKYKWMFIVGGAGFDLSVGIGIYPIGMFEIEKTAPDRWKREYWMVLGQVSIGADISLNVGYTTSDTFETSFDWRPGNFPGYFDMVGASASAISFAGGPGTITFYGDGTRPPLSVSGGGLTAVAGLTFGVEAGIGSGWLIGGKRETIRSAAARDVPTAEGAFERGESVHFEVNDPSLTEAGLAAIRHACAGERAAFEDPSTRLEINGYASTAGPEARNEQLSEFRAQNVYQAIVDVLGDAMRVPLANTAILPHGERAARRQGSPDRREDPFWRRVDVRINGRLIVVLR